jgi:hypothetical protein
MKCYEYSILGADKSIRVAGYDRVKYSCMTAWKDLNISQVAPVLLAV